MTSVRQEAVPDQQQLITDLVEKITPYDIMVVSRRPSSPASTPTTHRSTAIPNRMSPR